MPGAQCVALKLLTSTKPLLEMRELAEFFISSQFFCFIKNVINKLFMEFKLLG